MKSVFSLLSRRLSTAASSMYCRPLFRLPSRMQILPANKRFFELPCSSFMAASMALAASGSTYSTMQALERGEDLSMDFQGKLAVVTGSADGLGRQIANRLVLAGARVILVDRNEALLKAAVADLGANAAYVACDVRKLDEIKAKFENMGCIDNVELLVNCAGIAVFQEFFSVSEDVWDATMDINAKAIVFLSQLFATGMASRGGGSIVNISSQSSTVAVSTKHTCYSTSKAAVDHITRLTSICLAKHNIRVNAVNPTVVRTELAIKAHGEEGLKKMAAKIPLGRICECDDVANAVLFLLSDRASMITGVTLPVDGGFVVSRP